MRQTCALNEEKKVFMNKKLLVSAFLFFFIFSSWMLASEKTYIKEFLGFHYSPGYDYEITPDHTLPSGFESVPFLTFYVPPSPKESNAIFFDIFAQVIFKWSGLLDRIAHSKIVLNIISDVIPSDIWVYATNAVLSVWEKNLEGNYDTDFRRSWKRNWRIMERNNLDWFYVESKLGDEVSDERKTKIINDLIDNGFSVEINTEGTIQGVSILIFLTCQVEVTRINKK